MPLIEKGDIVANTWTEIADDAALPDDGGVVVSLKRWQAEAETLRGRNQPVGVRIPTGTQAAALDGLLAGLALVAVEMPKFRDGRAFTVARDLREHLGFTGTIRAVGHILPDQYAYLTRCGVDQVAIPESAKVETWKAALSQISSAYQNTIGDDTPLSPLKRMLQQAG